jgi:adenylyl-sulfate kinase
VTFDLPLAIGGLIVGIVVGLTGMGGGALMTPMLVFFFRTDPLTAISSDLLASFVMKPAGALVHLRRGTINLDLVKYLCLGSIPAAFSGAWVISLFERGEALDAALRGLLGLALMAATGGLVVRSFMQMWTNRLPLGEGPAKPSRPVLQVRPVPTIALGAIAGFMVGLTSVGSGSIIIVALLLMYPGLKASSLVGTDLAQAIPLVGAAALGHLLLGDVSFTVTTSLLVGAIPGAWLGAQVSSRAPGGLIRRALVFLLLGSGLRLLGVATEIALLASIAVLVVGSAAWITIRRRVRTRAARAREEARMTDAAEIDRRPTSGGAVVFLTGLSGAGKSTIASALADALRDGGRPDVSIIDGDVLRQELTADLGFDRASRERNVEQAAMLAAERAARGELAVTALIAPFASARRRARELIEPVAPFLLVFIHAPLDVAEERDPKGLYRRARAGEIPDFTGIDSPYEAPDDADLMIDTTRTSVPEAVALIRTKLRERLAAV